MGLLQRTIDRWRFNKVGCLVIQLAGNEPNAHPFWAHTFVNGKDGLSLSESRQEQQLSLLKENPLDMSYPWVISLYGKGIVYHLSTSETDQAWSELISDRLPAAKAIDFVGQGNPTGQLYGLSRKSTVEHLLNYLLQDLKIPVQSVVFGITTIPATFPLLPDINQVTQLVIGDQVLSLSMGKLNQLRGRKEEAPFSTRIDQVAYSHDQLMAIGSILPLYGSANFTHWQLDVLAAPSAASFQKKWLAKIIGVFGLVILLILAMINFVVFDQLSKQQAQTNYQTQRFQSQINKLDSLTVRLENRQKLLGENAETRRSFSSFYADRLAATIPAGIQLQELIIFPKIEKRNEQRNSPPQFDRQRIIIEGNCSSNQIISSWLSLLGREEWVKSAELTENQLPIFIIELSVDRKVLN